MKYLIVIITLLFATTDIHCYTLLCDSSFDCSNLIQNAFCTSNKICSCAAGYVISSDVTTCIKEILNGDTCQESNQCSHMLTGSGCNGICQCAEGYTYIRGRCKKLVNLGSPCVEDTDCVFGYDRESVICNQENHQCVCADNYYLRSENICRRNRTLNEQCIVQQDCEWLGEDIGCVRTDPVDESIKHCLELNILDKEINDMPPTDNSISKIEIHVTADIEKIPKLAKSFDTCDVEDENACTTVENSECIEEECQCKIGFTQTENENNEIECVEDLDACEPNPCSAVPNSDCVEGECLCKIGFTQTENENNDIECNQVYDSECDVTNSIEQCTDLPHSECVNDRCQCARGYYENGFVCKAELGEVTASEKLCDFSYNHANQKCLCEGALFYGDNLRTCWKVGNGVNWACTQQSQCTPYGPAFCPANPPRRCACHNYAVYDAEKELCIPKSGIGSQCQNTADCIAQVNNTICSENLCICQNDHIEINQECKAGLSAICETDEDCIVNNAECQQVVTSNTENKSCNCKSNYVRFQDTCLKKAEKYGDQCEVTEQCEPLLSNLAKCENSNCTCDDNAHYKNEKCYEKKVLGEACKTPSECFVTENTEAVECRNSVCDCKIGYPKDIEKQICIIPTPKKNSSGRPSVLKVITLLLIASAILITGAALKEAYF